jgi:hypothetical protein
MLLKTVYQVISDDDTVSWGDHDDRVVGAAGSLEDVGELRDEVDVGIPTFADDAGIEALVAPAAVESGIYQDYYDTYGVLEFLYHWWIVLDALS